MALEIERKFICTLTKEEALKLSFSNRSVTSVYLESSKESSFRVVKDVHHDGLVVCKWTKKTSLESALIREEKEEYLPEILFNNLNLDQYPKVIKQRYLIEINNKIWEIDFFEDYDFVIAELEFKTLEEAENFIDFPSWIIKEVTHNPYYLNCLLYFTLNINYTVRYNFLFVV